jgi:2-C-methyl-D-erythritol 4-phosphate cytidylyltransferase
MHDLMLHRGRAPRFIAMKLGGEGVRRMADVRVKGPAVDRGEEILIAEDAARPLFQQVALAEEFPDFLTLPAYELID